MTELWTLSARDLAGGIARKDFSCTEVIEAHLRRIEAVNPGLNAIVKTFGEEARSDAAKAFPRRCRRRRVAPPRRKARSSHATDRDANSLPRGSLQRASQPDDCRG